MYKYLKKIGNTDHILEWKSEGSSDEIIKASDISNNGLVQKSSYVGNKTRVKCHGSCLKQDKITYTHGTTLNIYVVQELGSNLNYNKSITLENCLFGSIKSAKSADINKYKCSRCGIRFHGNETFLFPNGGFGADVGSSVHFDKGPTQGLDDTTIIAEKKFSIGFTVIRKQFI